jgi:UDP-N-acetylglucosamine acyltransferase
MGGMNSIHPNAKLGDGVSVGDFSVIEEDVVIGSGTVVGHNVTILNGSRIGKNCTIFPGAVIGAIPQDLKYNGEYTTAEIGDNTVIRECVTINKGTTDRMKTVVGSACLLMAYVHIAHDVIVGDHCILANQASIAGHVIIDDHVIIEGGAVAVQQFVHIGQHAFITGGSKVRKNIPPYIKAGREPLAYVGINSVGLKRRGFEDEDIRMIENIYRIIFVQNANLGKGLEQVDLTIPASKYKEEIISFIKNSDKGVVKGLV